MTLRQVWILNYGTAVTLLTFLSWMLLETIDPKTPDKDINTIYMVVTIVIYLGFLSHLFYKTIYQWGLSRRLPFYLTSVLTVVVSIIILSENIGVRDIHYSVTILLTLILCGVHVVSYSLGMLASNRMKELALRAKRV